ncbi:MAG: ABC transporter ATP-binding protein [Alphaproteobacteria bacterium]|nr:ABC transporter ATP-binding protein [Alphaproteobacteria bacterium]
MPRFFSNPSFRLYRRLITTYVLRYRRALVIGAVCMVLTASAAASQAYLMQPVLDDIFVHKNEAYLFILPLALILAALISAVGDYGQSLALKYVGQKVVADMQGDLFSHLMHADIRLFHDQSSGRLISRLTNDIMAMRQSVSQVIVGLIKECLTALFLLGVMLWQSAAMSVIACAILLFAVLPVARLGRRMRKVADETQSRLGDFTAQLDDTFQGVRMVKAYGREDFESARARQTIRQLFKLYYRAARVQSASGPIMMLLSGIAVAAIIWFGGFKVLHGTLTPGQFFSFLTAMLMVYRPVKIIAGLNTQLQEGMASAARFFSVIDTKAAIAERPGAPSLTLTHGAIDFSNVDFHYHEGSGGVSGLNFHVPAGKTVALVGSSGSGKTTIMNLLLRFYDVNAGRITIDGTDIRDVTIRSLRDALALVSQDIVLFNDSVRANIAYGLLDADEEAIIAAAQKAHAHEFISALPQGYDTPIGPAGVKLSGGQRQRISIARAILKNAPILLLDEATSALDTASERAVQEALSELMQGRTTLVIAHRLTTIADADLILVLEGGRIEAQGTHHALLESSAGYRHMHQLYHQQGSA